MDEKTKTPCFTVESFRPDRAGQYRLWRRCAYGNPGGNAWQRLSQEDGPEACGSEPPDNAVIERAGRMLAEYYRAHPAQRAHAAAILGKKRGTRL